MATFPYFEFCFLTGLITLLLLGLIGWLVGPVIVAWLMDDEEKRP